MAAPRISEEVPWNDAFGFPLDRNKNVDDALKVSISDGPG
jgi:hypothetical protein